MSASGRLRQGSAATREATAAGNGLMLTTLPLTLVQEQALRLAAAQGEVRRRAGLRADGRGTGCTNGDEAEGVRVANALRSPTSPHLQHWLER